MSQVLLIGLKNSRKMMDMKFKLFLPNMTNVLKSYLRMSVLNANFV